MSVAGVQREVTSVEFAEWRAFYRLLDEQQTADHGEPSPDELGAKIHAWAASQKARKAT